MTRGVEPVVLNLVDEMENAFSPMLATPGTPDFLCTPTDGLRGIQDGSRSLPWRHS